MHDQHAVNTDLDHALDIAIAQHQMAQVWRTGRHPRRGWTPAEVRFIDAHIGKLAPEAMAQQLGRSPSSMLQKIQSLGYNLVAEARLPLGLTAAALSRRLEISLEQVWRDVQRGVICAERHNRKDYCIAWPEVASYERWMTQLTCQRERVLARIKEPVLTKQQAMALLGLSETHITRYLQAKILKAWKVPCKYQPSARQRWEWLVSRASAEKVKADREAGRLRLRKQAYRQLQQQANAEIARLRRERRLGLRDDLKHPRSAVVQGCFTVRQVASHVQLSEAQVYEHLRLGRLDGRCVNVGARRFWVIAPEALQPYLDWCQRSNRATGPLKAWHTQVEKVHASGRMTLAEAAQTCKVKVETLAAAVQRGQLRCKKIGNLRAVTHDDLAAYLTHRSEPCTRWEKRMERIHAKGWLTACESAKEFGVSVAAIYTAAREGRLRSRQVQGLRAFSRAELRAYAQAVKQRRQTQKKEERNHEGYSTVALVAFPAKQERES
jgi:hypothetical protein